MLLSSCWFRLSIVILYFFLGKSKTNVIIKPHLTIKCYGSSYKECPPGTSGLGLINDKWHNMKPWSEIKVMCPKASCRYSGKKIGKLSEMPQNKPSPSSLGALSILPSKLCSAPRICPLIKIRLNVLWPKEQERDCSHKEPHTPRLTSPCKNEETLQINHDELQWPMNSATEDYKKMGHRHCGKWLKSWTHVQIISLWVLMLSHNNS